MKVLVCGGTDYTNRFKLIDTLAFFHRNYGFTELIHGGAEGADTMAGEWAKNNNIQVFKYKANWIKHSLSAGPIRNQEMLDKEKPDLVIAFPSPTSRGTYDLIRRAQLMGIKTIII